MKLRDYQQKVYDEVIDAFNVHRVVLAVIPTGGGKTVLFSKTMRDWKGATGAVVHRKEILGQISLSLAALDVKHRIIAPTNTVRGIRRRHLKKFGKSFIDDRDVEPCFVASVQTLASKRGMSDPQVCRLVNQCRLAVFDEAHHYVRQGVWGRAVDRFEHCKMLHVTASPERADGKGLHKDADGYVDHMVMGPTTRWLIDQGYLSPFKYYAPDTDLDVSDIAVTASGDFNAKALRARVVDTDFVGDMTAHIRKFASGKKSIVFSTDVETAEEQARSLTSSCVPAVMLHGGTEAGQRDKTLEIYESTTDIHSLVNVDLFDEGFDVPAVDCCAQARPTESLAKFLQMVGRALRPVYAPGYDLSTQEGRLAAIAAGPKPYAIIIDGVRNWERHGMPDWPRDWNLYGKDKSSRGESDTIPQVVCTNCTQVYPAYLKPCPYCGASKEPAGRSSPGQVDGDLRELDVDAMAALFEKMERAEMKREQFEVDLVTRNVPPIGRPRQLRAHEHAKYRRNVLRNLIGWWVGMQDGRDLGEIHRRFYFRFGVDIATAHTLDATGTDQLIQTISNKFHKDIIE